MQHQKHLRKVLLRYEFQISSEKLFFLVTVLPKTLFALMGSHLMSFSLFSARHDS